MGEARIVEQAAKGGQADGSLSDMLMAIETGAARGFGVVHVPDADLLEADGAGEQGDGFLVAGCGDNVVSGDVAVTGVEACADGDDRAQAVQELGDLFEAAAEGELGSGGVLDEDAEVAVVERNAVDGLGDAVGGERETLVACESAPRAGMNDQELG